MGERSTLAHHPRMRILLLLAALPSAAAAYASAYAAATSATGALRTTAPRTALPRRPHLATAPTPHRDARARHARAPPARCVRMASGADVDAELDVWRFREGFVRGSYGIMVNWREDGREDDEERLLRPDAADASAEATRSAFVASATAVVIGALDH